MGRSKAPLHTPLINAALVVLIILIVMYVPLRVRMERSERALERLDPHLTISVFFTNWPAGRPEPIGKGTREHRRTAPWASLIEERRHERPVVLIGAGDCSFSMGPPTRDPGDGELFEEIRRLRYDAVGIGECETRIGLDGILTQGHEHGIPFVSSNIIDRRTSKPAARTSIIKELGGTRTFIGRKGSLRVGIFSVALPDCIYASHQDAPSRYDVVDPKLAALEAVTNLRAAGCRLIIAISHQGWTQSLELARDVGGIDVVLNGHRSHDNAHEELVGRTIVVDPGTNGRSFTEVLMTFAGDSLIATPVDVRAK